MSNEELVAEIRQGKTELMEQLWDQVKRFVYWKARAVYISPGAGYTLEDLEQSGYLALAPAVETYDPERGAFLTWLSYYLKKEFAAAGGARGTKKRPLNVAVSLDAPLSLDDVDDGTLHDIVASKRADGGDAYTDAEDAIYRE